MGLSMKWVALLLLVMQTVATVLVIRLASLRSPHPSNAGRFARGEPQNPPPRFLNTTVVALAELFKFLASFVVFWGETGFGQPVETLKRLTSSLLSNPLDTLKLGVPAALYTLQNNLVFVALENLSGAVYQVTYQLKILTTAVLSVLILGRRIPLSKWGSLLLLTAGVILIQLATLRTLPQAAETRILPIHQKTSVTARALSVLQVPAAPFATVAVNTGAADIDAEGEIEGAEEKRAGGQGRDRTKKNTGNLGTGLLAVLAACLTSAFAGVYLEKILHQTSVGIWVRNIQLAAFGILFGIVTSYWNDGDRIQVDGFFQGYTPLVWTIVLLQGLGGLIVAAVLKYADNILKCFGNASSIVLSCLLSWWLLDDYSPNALFCIGAVLVISATCIYTLDVSRGLALITSSKRTARHSCSTVSPAVASDHLQYARVSTQTADTEEDEKKEVFKHGGNGVSQGFLPLEMVARHTHIVR